MANGLTKVAQADIKALDLDMKQVSRGFSVLNANQVQKLFNSTPAKWKFARPAKGGGEWTYVRKGYVRRTLDSVFGFDWNFVTTTPLDVALIIAEKTGTVVLQGYIEARVLDERGQLKATLKRSGTGRAEVKFERNAREMPDGTTRRAPLDFGNDVKAAETDCFKRAAAMFGVAADVFEKEEFFEIKITDADENDGKTENIKSKVDEAKRQMVKIKSKKVDNGSTGSTS